MLSIKSTKQGSRMRLGYLYIELWLESNKDLSPVRLTELQRGVEPDEVGLGRGGYGTNVSGAMKPQGIWMAAEIGPESSKTLKGIGPTLQTLPQGKVGRYSTEALKRLRPVASR